jgi:hypothetical protein
MNAEGVAENPIGVRVELVALGDGRMDRFARLELLGPAGRIDLEPGNAYLRPRRVEGLRRGRQRAAHREGGQQQREA